MNRKLVRGLSGIFIITAAFILTDCATVKSGSTAGRKKVLLQYNYPQDNAVKYQLNSKIVQTLDIQGMVMDVNVITTSGFSIKSAGKEADNLKLTILIDTMAQSMETPNGYSGGAITDAIGKSFDMVISEIGKEIDLSGANELTYDIPGSGQTNAVSTFAEFFPDMPAGKVKPGHAWTSTDSVNAVSPTSTTVSYTVSENIFEGIENIDGIECAKITSTLSGNQTMETQAQGMDIKTSGPFTGTSTVFFAIGEGYFVKQTNNIKLDGELELTYPQEMTMPLTMEMSSVNEVVK